MAASTSSSRGPVVGSHSSVSSILRRPFINAGTTLKLPYVFIVDDESLFHQRSALFPSAGLPAYAVSMKYSLYQAWWDSGPAPSALRVPVVGLQVKAVRSIGQVLQERRITHPMGARVGCSQPSGGAEAGDGDVWGTALGSLNTWLWAFWMNLLEHRLKSLTSPLWKTLSGHQNPDCEAKLCTWLDLDC